MQEQGQEEPEQDVEGPALRPPARALLAARALLPWLLAACLLVPKLVLIRFANQRMFMRYGLLETLVALQQDLLAAALAGVLLVAWGRRATTRRVHALGGLAVGCLLVVLFLDMRVRQLWLRPIDLDMLSYFVANLDDLRSGGALFFNHNAGLGLTFHKLLVLFGAGYGALWAASLVVSQPSSRPPSRRTRRANAAVLVLLFVAACCVGQHRYRTEENVLVSPAVNLVRSVLHSDADERELAAAFDQPARPLAEVLAPPRRILADVEPFTNVVIVFMESVRLKSVDPQRTPVLRRLAREGLEARCYTCLPHSSKAYYAVLCGRHPFPGIEMRESLRPRSESLLWLVREQLGANTRVYSSAYLAFENTSGLLTAAGVEVQQESPADPEAGESSFGKSDAALYAMVPRELADAPRPFVCGVINLAAHYPYVYPGKGPSDGDGLESYERSLVRADAQLEELLTGLREQGVLDDTLLVLVGDHGESFGEHGHEVHNNSLYEEEVTVPLVFWSADGRLRHDQVLVAQQIDVAPTVADLLGLQDGELPVQGRSLLRAEGPAPIYLTTFFEGVGQALIEDGTKWLYEPDGGRLVKFDLLADPGEQRPQEVGEAERERVVQRLQAFRAYQRRAFAE